MSDSSRLPIDPDIGFRLLRAVEKNSDLSQRQIAKKIGVSLGATNYCIKALIEKGYLKARNFSASGNKRAYTYILTPRGIAEKSALTAGFLRRKRAEYDALKAEIEHLEAEFEANHLPVAAAKEQHLSQADYMGASMSLKSNETGKN